MTPSFFKPEDCDWQTVIAEGSLGTSKIKTLTVERANAILAERGVRVYSTDQLFKSAEKMIWSHEQTEREKTSDTHTALLIAVEPLRKDTAEDLLREFVEQFDRVTRERSTESAKPLLDRARALLGGER